MFLSNVYKKLGKKRIYADAAAATPLSRAAKQELVRLLELFGNPGGLHDEAQVAKAELEVARDTVATAIGAHNYEVFFTGSGTEANNLAIFGIIRPLLKKHGSMHAVTSAIEHSSILEPLLVLEKEGLELTLIPVDSEGLVDPKKLAEAIKENTVFVSIQYINSEVGTIQPIREIAKEVRGERKGRGEGRGLPSDWRGNFRQFPSKEIAVPDLSSSFPLPLYFHVDASQAPLWVDIKVEKLGVDLLTLDAQKIMGPKGVGALFVKRSSEIEPLIYGGGQENGLRSGTPNTPLIGAFAVALTEAQQQAEQHSKKVSEVTDYLWQEIKKTFPSALLNGPHFENRVANNINISIPGLDAQMAVIALNVNGVASSTKSACSVGSEDPSHVIQALGTPAELAGTAIRFTLLPTATKRDADHIISALRAVTKLYKN